MSEDGREATLRVEDLPVIDSFQILGKDQIPASLSFEVKWSARGESRVQGSTSPVEPTDPAAFSGRFFEASATGSFSGSELGFSFTSKSGADTKDTYAEMGTERNGVFLAQG